MLSWIIQVTFISILLIILVHHFIDYFKTMLTVPKIKNLATTSLREKYEDIFKLINNNDLEITTNNNNNTDKTNNNNTDNTNNNNNNTDNTNKTTNNNNNKTNNNNNNNQLKNEDELMKDELTNFIKTQLQSTTNP